MVYWDDKMNETINIHLDSTGTAIKNHVEYVQPNKIVTRVYINDNHKIPKKYRNRNYKFYLLKITKKPQYASSGKYSKNDFATIIILDTNIKFILNTKYTRFKSGQVVNPPVRQADNTV